MGTNVTMKQIAERAGISRPNVSKILNHKPVFASRETRERVWRIARELNYQPNYFATSLKKGRTNTIGIMGSRGTMLGFNKSFYSRIAAAAESELVSRKSSYSLLAFGANYHETFDKSLELIARGMVDGLLLITLSQNIKHFERDLLPVLRDYNLPFVVIHSLARELDYNNVGIDSFEGGYAKAVHLAEKGCKTFGFITLPRMVPHKQEELEGFKKGLGAAGLADSSVSLLPLGFGSGKPLSQYQAAYQQVMTLDPIPDALIAFNDEGAFGAIRALQEKGLRVPDDIKVMGNDDEPVPEYCRTTLTTMHHPMEEKGAAALGMLLDLLEGRLQRDEIHRICLKPELVIRQSC